MSDPPHPPPSPPDLPDEESWSEDQLEALVFGELDPHRREALERLALADDVLFETLEAIETEAVDDFVAEQLSPSRQKTFSERLETSSRLRKRVATARALRQQWLAQTPHDGAHETTDKSEDDDSTTRWPPPRSGSSDAGALRRLPIALLAATLVIGAGLSLLGGWNLFRQQPFPAAVPVELFVSAPVRGPAAGEPVTLSMAPVLELHLELADTSARGPFDVRLRRLPRGRAWSFETIPENPAPTDGATNGTTRNNTGRQRSPHLTVRLATADLEAGTYHLKVWSTAPSDSNPALSHSEPVEPRLVGVMNLRLEAPPPKR